MRLVYPARNPNELFSEESLTDLRAAYKDIDRIDPCSPAYSRMCEMLDRMGITTLKQIAWADIKFISLLAANRVRQRGL